jgi:hypothetical protein
MAELARAVRVGWDGGVADAAATACANTTTVQQTTAGWGGRGPAGAGRGVEGLGGEGGGVVLAVGKRLLGG